VTRIFDFWAIVYFWAVFENDKISPYISGVLFSLGKSYVLIFRKKWFGLHDGRFFHETHLVTLVAMPSLHCHIQR
jgi:hypothetical protein